MELYAGMTALGDESGKQDAGLIMIVGSPGSKQQIGVATGLAEAWHGKHVYMVTLTGHSLDTSGKWILEDGRFRRVE